MRANVDNRRASYALSRVRSIKNKADARARKAQAARAIALIRNAGLLKALSFIKSNSNLREIFEDILGWLEKSNEKDGPQLQVGVKAYAKEKTLVDYVAGLDSHLEYIRVLNEVIAVLEHIKLMAEGQKNTLYSLPDTSAGDDHA